MQICFDSLQKALAVGEPRGKMRPRVDKKATTPRPIDTLAVRLMDPRQAILQRIGDINNFDLPRPLVTLEEFFVGNDDGRSLRWDSRQPPSPQEWLAFLQSLRARNGVTTVLVEVAELERPDAWPCSDAIWIVTTLSLGKLKRLVPDRYQPDRWCDYPPDHAMELIDIPDHAKAFGMIYN